MITMIFEVNNEKTEDNQGPVMIVMIIFQL